MRAQLAETVLRHAWQAGRALTAEQTIAEAQAFARDAAMARKNLAHSAKATITSRAFLHNVDNLASIA